MEYLLRNRRGACIYLVDFLTTPSQGIASSAIDCLSMQLMVFHSITRHEPLLSGNGEALSLDIHNKLQSFNSYKLNSDHDSHPH
jgi:hypothetical protein